MIHDKTPLLTNFLEEGQLFRLSLFQCEVTKF